ncbi:DNA/RNA helicase, DEAD/DEAH box type, N-terminal [Artemisia annua]|uniref:DNA/RNA helicase, DEAD/DEAH box type, N-terminal n=1 Tax=Artemisia annua TaxID=35608 RepID=A0A2U1Q1P3_ARTAN|nr:DNA/RNA helicase, DEAD/DEAH box type, N-terminal [Artemisia annua]
MTFFGSCYNRNEECLLDKNKLCLERTTNAFHKYEADQTTQGNDGWKQNSYIYGTKKGCDQVTLQLRMDGWRLLSIHGDKSQDERDWVFAELKSGRSLIMTATHVADLRIMFVFTAKLR